MKVEDPSALLVQWFYHKPKYLPKGDESSWQNHTRFAARNATTIKTFIVMAKINMGIRNIFAAYAGINLRRMPLRPAGPEDRACALIRSALSAGRPCSSTTTTNITQITAAVTKDAIIPSSCQKQPPSQRLPCPSCREKPISSECAIRCIPF